MCALGVCRDDQSDKILQKMLDEMQRLHTLIDLERKVRDETTKSMARMFDELSAKIQHDVEVRRVCARVYVGGGLRRPGFCCAVLRTCSGDHVCVWGRWSGASASRRRTACCE